MPNEHFTEAIAPAPPEGHISGADVILFRNQFYRDSYQRVMILCLCLFLLIISLIGFIVLQKKMAPTPLYFATNEDGTLTKTLPLNKPNLSTNALLAWSAEAASSIYNYNFVHYRENLQKTQDYFTPEGYQQMLVALKKSGNLTAVREKKYVVSAKPTAAPIITSEGLLKDRYYWKLDIPMRISYENINDSLTENIVITMLITRTPIEQTPKGVGIAQFIVRQGEVQL